MKIGCVVRELHPRQIFRIARARRTEVRNVFVRIEADGAVGYGEASPNSFYEETAEGVVAKVCAAGDWMRDAKVGSVADVAQIWDELWPVLSPSRAAQCAIDLALWDWLGQRESVSVSELAWGQPARAIPTFCTIGLSTAEELEAKLIEMGGFPFIKIKSDRNADLSQVLKVRAASDAVLAIDANCAWADCDLGALAAELQQLEVAFIEQPLPPEDDALLPRVAHGPAIMADESCVTEADVERMAGRFDGFNIKLVKCGGITPALRMARRGRELGLKTMVGCMLESSVLIAAGAVVAQQTDYADLDGAWLLSDDPFRGWTFARGILSPPASPGLGANPHAPIFPDF